MFWNRDPLLRTCHDAETHSACQCFEMPDEHQRMPRQPHAVRVHRSVNIQGADAVQPSTSTQKMPECDDQPSTSPWLGLSLVISERQAQENPDRRRLCDNRGFSLGNSAPTGDAGAFCPTPGLTRRTR